MTLTLLPHRSLIRVTGEDSRTFLQGLITSDVLKLSPEKPQYAAMLTPQGKIIADFFLSEHNAEILLECWTRHAAALLQKLQMYKLRSKVMLLPDESLRTYHSTTPQEDSFADPRHPAMGYRFYSSAPQSTAADITSYTALRLQIGIPESEDIIEDRSFPMELGMNLLHAISYTKGCYIGQEVVARSKTRGVLHKAIHKVQSVNGHPLPPHNTPVMLGEAEIGILRTTEGAAGLAILRIEEATKNGLSAAGIPLTAELPDWFLLPTPAM